MKREPRLFRCDSNPEGATRPDIVPAPVRFGEESSPASSVEPMRELAPYPGLRPHADEPTVKYALMQGGSTVTPRHHDERPSDVPVEHRSGTRATPTSIRTPLPSLAPPQTVVPPSGVQAKPDPARRIATPQPTRMERFSTPLPKTAERFSTPLPKTVERFSTPLPKTVERFSTPLPRSAERYSTPSLSFVPPPRPVPESLPPSVPAPPPVHSPRGPSALGVVLILLTTTVVAATIGAALGDGTLQRLYTRWSAAAATPAVSPPSAAAVSPSRAPPARPSAAAPAERSAPVTPRSAATSSAPALSNAPATATAPAVRFQDLPTAEPVANEDAPVEPARQRPVKGRRH